MEKTRGEKMKYIIYLKETVDKKKVDLGGVEIPDLWVNCDKWDVSKQGFVVAYDKKIRSTTIVSPHEAYDAKMFIPRENILFIVSGGQS